MAAQGIVKTIAYKKQTGLGAPASGSGGQLLRRRTATFNAPRDTYQNDEIASHQQSTGATAGVKRTTGQLNALLSPDTYADLIQSLLRKDFAATAAITGMSITITGSGPTYTIARAAGDFLTGGVKVGDIVRLTAGSFNANNLNKNLLVTAVTALNITVRVINGGTLTAEGPIASATLTIPGKKSWVPTSGHTNDYYTFEQWYADVTKSELFTDVKPASLQVTVPASGNVEAVLDLPGLNRTRGTSQVLTSPTAETTTNAVTSVFAALLVGGVVTPITAANFTIDGATQPGEPEVGSNSIADHQRGRISVTGQIASKFTDTVLQAMYDAQTVTSLILVMADSGADAADFVTFVFPALKFFGDEADDGEKEIVRTYPFTAQINSTGGAALANHQTIVSIQDSQA